MLQFRTLTSMSCYKIWHVTKEDVLLFMTIRYSDLIFFGQKLYTNDNCDTAHRGKEKNFCAEIWVKMHRPRSNANAPKCEKIYEKACIFSCPFIFTRCHTKEVTKYGIFNCEKFSRGSSSYLVVTLVTSICYKWLQKFQLLQKVTNYFKSSNCNKKLPILGVT